MTTTECKVFVFFILFLTIIGFSGCFIMNEGGFVKVKSIDENFEIPQDTKLDIVNYIEGDISIFRENTSIIRINGEERARSESVNFDDIIFNYTLSNNSMTIQIYYTGKVGLVALHGLQVIVPLYVDIKNIYTEMGNIYLESEVSLINLTTKNGGAELYHVSGYVNASSFVHATYSTEPTKNTTIISKDSVIIYMKPSLNIFIEMKTINGSIIVNNNFNISYTNSSKNYVYGKLGNGGYVISFSTINGDIQLINSYY